MNLYALSSPLWWLKASRILPKHSILSCKWYGERWVLVIQGRHNDLMGWTRPKRDPYLKGHFHHFISGFVVTHVQFSPFSSYYRAGQRRFAATSPFPAVSKEPAASRIYSDGTTPLIPVFSTFYLFGCSSLFALLYSKQNMGRKGLDGGRGGGWSCSFSFYLGLGSLLRKICIC